MSKFAINLPDELIERLYHLYLEKGASEEDDEKNPVAALVKAILQEQSSSLIEVATTEPDAIILTVKTQIKDLLVQDLGSALDLLKSKLKAHSEVYDDLIGLFARYNRMTRYLQKGILDIPSAESEFVKIENAVIFTLNRLKADDLS